MNDEKPQYPIICICIMGKLPKSNFKKLRSNTINVIEREKENKKEFDFSDVDSNNLSILAFNNSEYDDKKKIEQDITLQISDVKENYEKSLKKLNTLKSKTKDVKTLENIDFYYNMHKHALEDNYPEKSMSKFFIKINLHLYKKLPTSLIKSGDFIDEFKDVKEVLSIVKDFKTKVSGYTCNKLAYDKKKYELIGGINFPFDFSKTPAIKILPFADNLISAMGNPKLVNIGFEFDKSPIGLESIDFSNNKNNYIVSLAYNYNTDDLEDIVKKNYLQSLAIPKIFLRDKK